MSLLDVNWEFKDDQFIHFDKRSIQLNFYYDIEMNNKYLMDHI